MKKSRLNEVHFALSGINQSNEMLSSKTSNGRVISTISHEFRTPLAVIESNLQFIKKYRENKRFSEEYLHNAFELCEEAVKNMSRILEDFSWLNNSSKSSTHVRSTAFSLSHFFETLLKENSSNNDIKRINDKYAIVQDFICLDKNLLRQLILNVISNALKYSNEEVTMTVSQNALEKNISITVEDKGIGISEEEIKHIFDPFFRGANTKKLCGTGLGLAVVNECVNALYGQIKVNSILNRGTTVSITIPYETQILDLTN